MTDGELTAALRARIAAEHAALARVIEPLPGGLAALRARIAAEDAALARVIAPLPGGLDALRARVAAVAADEAALAQDVVPLPGGLAALRARVADAAADESAVVRDVAPLPSGLVALRRAIRGEARRRFVPVALASVAAVAIALVIVTRSAPAHADRAAMKQLLGGAQPHPGAAALGLVDAPQLVTSAGDPRVPDQVVVFRWVQPRYAP
jgi:hypothetical protein